MVGQRACQTRAHFKNPLISTALKTSADASDNHLVVATLLLLAFCIVQTLIGGAKLLYSIPGYTVIAIAAVLTVFPRFVGPIRPVRGPVLATLAFIAYVVGRSLFSPVEYLARTDLYLGLAALAVYLLGAFSVTGSRERMFVFAGLFGFAFFQFAVGAIQFAEGNRFMPLPWIVREGYGIRASGLYICPNHFAGLMELLGLMGMSIVVWSRWKVWAKMLAAYTVVACFAGVGLSGSRGGYLSVAAGALTFVVLSLYAYNHLRHGRSWILGIGLAALLLLILGSAVVVLYKSDFLRARFENIADYENDRILLWEAALKQYTQNPLFGTGSGTYLYYGRHFRSHEVQNDPIHVHNDYLHLLCEYGIIGVALFGVFLLTHVAVGLRSIGELVKERLAPGFRSTSNVLALQIGCMCVVGAYVVHSVVDFNLHIPANTLLVAFIFGMLSNVGVQTNRSAEETRSRRPLLSWALPASGAALLVMACPKLPSEYQVERARVALRDGLWSAAVERARLAMESEKNNPNLYFYLGEGHRNIGETSEVPSERIANWTAAVDAFNKGLEVFPWDIRSLLRNGQALDALLRYSEAEAMFHRAIDADPKSANVYAFYGVHFHRQGLLDLAEVQYLKARKISPDPVAVAGLKEIQQARQKQRELLAPGPKR